jgi:peptidoglycan/LPS O-acetylase OafA/YrhL
MEANLMPFAGRESVIVFFVLSGFVIAYSTLSKQVSPAIILRRG